MSGHFGPDGGGVATLARFPSVPHAAPSLDLDLAAFLPGHTALLWRWSYAADGTSAHGTLATTSVADAEGFYQIIGIAGERNGVAIVGLQPAGTAIPGNEPFAVDNLISADAPQLTGNGFGYALADGTFTNPFFADFLAPATYLEFFSAPPFGPGIGPEDSEVPVHFSARMASSYPIHHRDEGHDAVQCEGAEHRHGPPLQAAGHATVSDWFA